MAVYEYRCEKCNKVSEVWKKISEPEPERCPGCGSFGGLKKLVSISSFHLKGKGWFKTDYPKGDK
jgi:putative FmdB family regulatory protein